MFLSNSYLFPYLILLKIVMKRLNFTPCSKLKLSLQLAMTFLKCMFIYSVFRGIIEELEREIPH